MLTNVEYRAGRGALIYTFGGNGVVSWSARYVASPSGVAAEKVAIVGACLLQVDLSDIGESTSAAKLQAPQRISLPADALLTDLVYLDIGSATVQTLAATRSTSVTVSVEPSAQALVVRVRS